MTGSRWVLSAAALALAWVLLCAPAGADTVGYWRLNDAAPGVTLTTAASELNNAALQGSGIGTGTRAFNADIPGLFIRQGAGGSIVPGANTASLQTASGGQVSVPFSSLLEPPSFTIEFFMKAAAQASWPGIVTKTNVVTSGRPTSWGIGKENNERLFIRVDTPEHFNATKSLTGSTADGNWHHFALTHDAATGIFRLYRDYTNVDVLNPNGNLTYDGQTGLRFGGMQGGGSFLNYTGLMDEVRFSDSALTAGDFLRAFGDAEVAVSGLGIDIPDGQAVVSLADGTQFGQMWAGGAGVLHTFTITNSSASQALQISDLAVPAGFQIVDALPASLAPGASDDLIVALDSIVAGRYGGDVSFTVNDLDETVFNFRVEGEVVPEPATLAMFGLALSALAGRLRRRRLPA